MGENEIGYYLKNWVTDDYVEKLNQIKVTKEIITNMPKIDLHAHLPGTISANTAYQLGVRNNFLERINDLCSLGKKKLNPNNPHKNYSDIFLNLDEVIFDVNGVPKNLRYNIFVHHFKSFDAVMATVQGHRYPPGGIQTEDDLKFVLRKYLLDCLTQKILYVELQQNIRIAYSLYPESTPKEARRKLYLLLNEMIEEFKSAGVTLRFLHCFNKTKAAALELPARERTIEAAEWLNESKEIANGVFVGIESAGHEKDQEGWPEHLADGYKLARKYGFGAEAHAGEGIGVEHMIDAVRTLPITRLAHGFQVVESVEAIKEVKALGVTLLMTPILNLFLGACVHSNEATNFPLPKSQGGQQRYLESLDEHPIFELVRKHKMKISLCSDNPELGGVSLQDLYLILTGVIEGKEHMPAAFLKCSSPFKLGEIAQFAAINIESAFCSEEIKLQLFTKIKSYFDLIAKTNGIL